MFSSGNSVEHTRVLIIFGHSKWNWKIKNNYELWESLNYALK